jgi:hypothetical protein
MYFKFRKGNLKKRKNVKPNLIGPLGPSNHKQPPLPPWPSHHSPGSRRRHPAFSLSTLSLSPLSPCFPSSPRRQDPTWPREPLPLRSAPPRPRSRTLPARAQAQDRRRARNYPCVPRRCDRAWNAAQPTEPHQPTRRAMRATVQHRSSFSLPTLPHYSLPPLLRHEEPSTPLMALKTLMAPVIPSPRCPSLSLSSLYKLESDLSLQAIPSSLLLLLTPRWWTTVRWSPESTPPHPELARAAPRRSPARRQEPLPARSSTTAHHRASPETHKPVRRSS